MICPSTTACRWQNGTETYIGLSPKTMFFLLCAQRLPGPTTKFILALTPLSVCSLLIWRTLFPPLFYIRSAQGTFNKRMFTGTKSNLVMAGCGRGYFFKAPSQQKCSRITTIRGPFILHRLYLPLVPCISPLPHHFPGHFLKLSNSSCPSATSYLTSPSIKILSVSFTNQWRREDFNKC